MHSNETATVYMWPTVSLEDTEGCPYISEITSTQRFALVRLNWCVCRFTRGSWKYEIICHFHCFHFLMKSPFSFYDDKF